MLVSAGAATADPGVAEKQAEAQRIVGEINALDARVGAAIERYDLANVKLHRIGHDLAQTRGDLRIARTNLKRAQVGLARQAVAVYTATSSDSTVEVLLGSSSLDDLLNRIDTVHRVSDQRAQLLGAVTKFRAQIARQAAMLQRAQVEQKQVVAARAAERASIETQLGQRRALLASVRTEISKLQEQERQRSLQIARALKAQPQPRQAAPAQPQQEQQQAPVESAAPVVGVSASTPEATVAPPPRYGGVVGIAMQYLGVPYVWGGASPSGFDCSGFVMYVFGRVGVSLPHSSYSQIGMGVPVSRDDLQPGDLVFFDGAGHVGIYIGGGNFVHAPHTGDVVKVSSISGWYASTYTGARRIV